MWIERTKSSGIKLNLTFHILVGLEYSKGHIEELVKIERQK